MYKLTFRSSGLQLRAVDVPCLRVTVIPSRAANESAWAACACGSEKDAAHIDAPPALYPRLACADPTGAR
jgi:hypothetical protein